mmetsp:Transcript_7394/g.6631  ORF Transcript_7394/g.6631 Transcript_7394/m.6631 type:complete len:151 (+) Transcript_7394:99-551(+)
MSNPNPDVKVKVYLKRYYRKVKGFSYYHTTIILVHKDKIVEIGYCNEGTGGSLTKDNVAVTVVPGVVLDDAHDYYLAVESAKTWDEIIQFALQWSGTKYILGTHDCGTHCRDIIEFAGGSRLTWNNINTSDDIDSFTKGKGYKVLNVEPR